MNNKRAGGKLARAQNGERWRALPPPISEERSPSRRHEELPDIRGGVHSDTGSYFDMSRTAINAAERLVNVSVETDTQVEQSEAMRNGTSRALTTNTEESFDTLDSPPLLPLSCPRGCPIFCRPSCREER